MLFRATWLFLLLKLLLSDGFAIRMPSASASGAPIVNELLPIDIVYTWVNGSDPQHQKGKAQSPRFLTADFMMPVCSAPIFSVGGVPKKAGWYIVSRKLLFYKRVYAGR